MSVSNEELVQKALITTDAIASAGKLNPAQSNKFIDYVFDLTSLRNNARIVKFTNESMEIDKIGVGRRVAMPKAEAADPGKRRSITTSKVTLTPREVMTPWEVSDNFAEINIEGRDVEDTIVRLMATQTGNDLEELYVNGNKLGPATLESNIVPDGDSTRYVKDTYLALVDGWAKLGMSGHTVDLAGQNIGLGVFGKVLRALPVKFRRNLRDLRWFLSPDLWQLFQEKLSTRATILGDTAAQSTADQMPGPFGIKAVPVPLWPAAPRVVEHVVLTSTTQAALLNANISNVIVTASTLNKTPVAPYVETTDYVVDYTAGKIARSGGGSAIGSGATVKVTYDATPQLMLTHKDNLIIAIGRDVRIEKDRDIFKTVNQYAITTKVDVQLEEVDAMAFGFNIGTGI